MRENRPAGTKVSRPEWPGEHFWPLAQGSERQFAAGEVLYLAGSEAHALYLVLEGRVRLLRERGGRAVYIHDEAPGGTLGEVPLFEGTTYPATAIAAEPTRCIVLHRDAVLAAVRENPDFALALLGRLAGRVRQLVERVDRNAAQSTLTRLADHLLARAAASSATSFTLGGTQQQTAEEIGTVRELVVRGLRTLRERSVIEARGGGRYVITNKRALHAMAHGVEE